MTKQLRNNLRNELAEMPKLRNYLKNYIEYCFSEIPSFREDNFISFKIKKRTLELIVAIFMFIFEENEYPIEVIA